VRRRRRQHRARDRNEEEECSALAAQPTNGANRPEARTGLVWGMEEASAVRFLQTSGTAQLRLRVTEATRCYNSDLLSDRNRRYRTFRSACDGPTKRQIDALVRLTEETLSGPLGAYRN
jgi:hypothetical protein